MLTLLATIIGLKFAEGSGGLEFDGFDGLLWAAVTCWLGGWAAQSVMALAFTDSGAGQSLPVSLALNFAIHGIATIVSLLTAWAVLPGVHVRRFYGLVLAAFLVFGFSYLAIMASSAAGLPF